MLNLLKFSHNSLSLSHIGYCLHFVVTDIQFLFGSLKSSQGGFNIGIRMYRCGDQAVDDMSLGDDGINDDGAENAVVLTQVHNLSLIHISEPTRPY